MENISGVIRKEKNREEKVDYGKHDQRDSCFLR